MFDIFRRKNPLLDESLADALNFSAVIEQDIVIVIFTNDD